MNIQVSNLNLNLIEADIQRLFAPFGEISSVALLRDKLNNRPSGRALVEMPVASEAQKALTSLQGLSLAGKTIVVNEVPSIDGNRFIYSMMSK